MIGLDDFELAAFVELSAKALDLPIPAAAREGVVANMRILAGHAKCVMAFPLPPETPLATDFRP